MLPHSRLREMPRDRVREMPRDRVPAVQLILDYCVANESLMNGRLRKKISFAGSALERAQPLILAKGVR
jgi:hypothetical protein